MKRLWLILISQLCLQVSFAAISPLSPVGLWQTVDDITQQPKGIVKIYMNADHHLFGKIIRLFPNDKNPPITICSKCTGELHNQPIVGMVVMTDLKQAANDLKDWDSGKIIDPKSGAVYRCKISLSDNGQELKVRGYFGIPLLGRTQIWHRQ